MQDERINKLNYMLKDKSDQFLNEFKELKQSEEKVNNEYNLLKKK